MTVNLWWVIYYGDGTRFSDRDGSPFDAPRLNVQLIAQKDLRVGYVLISSGDYYYWEPSLGGWLTTSGFGLYDHLIRCQTPLVLFGRHMIESEYLALFHKVKKELGDKSGWLMNERRPDD